VIALLRDAGCLRGPRLRDRSTAGSEGARGVVRGSPEGGLAQSRCWMPERERRASRARRRYDERLDTDGDDLVADGHRLRSAASEAVRGWDRSRTRPGRAREHRHPEGQADERKSAPDRKNMASSGSS